MVKLTVVPVIPLALSEAMKTATLATSASVMTRRGWVVERTFAWLNQFRRLRVRYDRRVDIHEASLSLGCVWICWKSLRKDWITA